MPDSDKLRNHAPELDFVLRKMNRKAEGPFCPVQVMHLNPLPAREPRGRCVPFFTHISQGSHDRARPSGHRRLLEHPD
eukprot:4191438-Alexandrium_andersonii.AAC.1